MHVKFLARGTGNAQKAAEYLLGERDSQGQPREGVEVLRGDPLQVAAVADSLEFKHRYTSAVIAWSPQDAPTEAEISRTLDEFEKTAWAGLGPDRYAWSAVLHRESNGGAHVHVLAARCELETGAEPEHRAAGLAEDVRRAAGRAEPRARLEPAGRPGAGPGAAAGPLQGLHRRGATAGRPRGRAGRAAADRGVPRAARRGGRGAQPRRRRGSAGGGGPRGTAAGAGLCHGAGPGERAAVAAERSDLWQGLRCRAA